MSNEKTVGVLRHVQPSKKLSLQVTEVENGFVVSGPRNIMGECKQWIARNAEALGVLFVKLDAESKKEQQ